MPYATNAGVRIYYEVVGSGAPLVLLHGLSDSAAVWHESGLLERLRVHRRLILIDARGHGRSDKPHDPAAYELRQRVGDVLAVLNTLGIERADCYGFAMGGWLGYGLARYTPERLVTLTINSAHPYAASNAFFRRILAGGAAAWIELAERMAGSLPPVAKRRMLRNDSEALRASVAQDRADLSPFLAGLEVPCRLIAGGADPDFPRIAQAALELPNACFFPLAGLNSFQAIWRGDLVAPIILEQGNRRAAARPSLRPGFFHRGAEGLAQFPTSFLAMSPGSLAF